ncbi:BLUF domain-containing protein [Thalassotalea sp. M1531]|uniref:BLUF domain-containing protein n=1 Tax=Thalassotalea algicola TaxID=2716224 RepID=A0A7Y0LCN0_9GAMM|nr:BLUF domain-containing protein [Thalassotalea algicola]NMP32124.1 BLUF domain-containing protein [Thalassotalea algicola]
MKSLIYLSQPNQEFSRSALTKLATEAAENNKAIGVTGFLRFQHNMFLQYLEGKSADVGNLLAVISRDKRHTIVNCLYNDVEHARRFSNWNMKFVDEGYLQQHSVESFLSNQLQLMKEQTLCDNQWQQLIWQGVDILSECAVNNHKIT